MRHRPSNISEMSPPQHAQDSTCHFSFQLSLKTRFSSTVRSQQAIASWSCDANQGPGVTFSAHSLRRHTQPTSGLTHFCLLSTLPSLCCPPLQQPPPQCEFSCIPGESRSSCQPSPASIAFCSTMLPREIVLKVRCAHDLYLLSVFSVVQSNKE